MTRWARMPMDRKQTQIFCPTLDHMIAEDHPVRLFHDILRNHDWSPWEAQYHLDLGQPPMHPRHVAGAILYGMSLGIRPSRKLEHACVNNLDFIWLVQGWPIDHSTFCNFRRKFQKALKTLFRHVVKTAMHLGLARLNQVALDGTRVKANSSRHGTATAENLERRLAMLETEIEQMFAEAETVDAVENRLFGDDDTPTKLPRGLSTRRERREKLKQALQAAEERDAKAKVPVADPDSTVQPNKEGGYAPNYTPMAMVESHGGFIVGTEVLADSDEGRVTVEMLDAVTEDFGEQPERLLADGAHGSGENLAALEEREVEAFIPLAQREDHADNPARRQDPTTPVPEADWPKLPRNARTGKLDRSAFVYDGEKDGYWCPMGRWLEFHRVQDKHRKSGGIYREYVCVSCEGCALSAECIAGKSGRPRIVSRDEHEPQRQAMDARMRSDEGRLIYRRRKWTSETPNGVIKELMNLRQFLLRGLEGVKTEWLWAATSYNLSKLARGILRLRQESALLRT